MSLDGKAPVRSPPADRGAGGVAPMSEVYSAVACPAPPSARLHSGVAVDVGGEVPPRSSRPLPALSSLSGACPLPNLRTSPPTRSSSCRGRGTAPIPLPRCVTSSSRGCSTNPIASVLPLYGHDTQRHSECFECMAVTVHEALECFLSMRATTSRHSKCLEMGVPDPEKALRVLPGWKKGSPRGTRSASRRCRGPFSGTRSASKRCRRPLPSTSSASDRCRGPPPGTRSASTWS